MCWRDFGCLRKTVSMWSALARNNNALTKTGTTAALQPIPIPRSIRHPNISFQVLVKELPTIAERMRTAEMQIAARRPKKYSFKGSESQQPIKLADR